MYEEIFSSAGRQSEEKAAEYRSVFRLCRFLESNLGLHTVHYELDAHVCVCVCVCVKERLSLDWKEICWGCIDAIFHGSLMEKRTFFF